MMNYLRISVLLVLSTLTLQTLSQHNSLYEHYAFRPYDKYVYQKQNRFHTAVRPYDLYQVNKLVDVDTLFRQKSESNVWNYILNNDLYKLSTEDFSFAVNPVIDFQVGNDPSVSKLSYINARGFMIDATIGKRVSLFTEFNEIQSAFRDDRSGRIAELGHMIIPGQGVARPFHTDGYDYAFARSYVSYRASDVFSFQLGNGKQFIGDGYRSLLLSDNAMNAPYFRITSDFWHIKYVNLWSQQEYIQPGQLPNTRYTKKWSAMHYLDWSVTKWLNLGMFETIIWPDKDSTGQRGLEFNYLNPVIFMRPVEFAIGSPDNVLLGLTGKITIKEDHILYGQLVLDEFRLHEFEKMNGWWGNKYGLQCGYKTFDLFTCKGLDLQLEYNFVRPFTYSHFNIIQNYTHTNMALAHPRGSNFYEGVGIVKYHKKRWFADCKVVYLISGEDTLNSNFGNDLFKPYTSKSITYGNYTAQLNSTNHVMYQDICLSYMINPKSNLCLSLGITNRIEDVGNNAVNHCMYYLALKTRLSNFYFDF